MARIIHTRTILPHSLDTMAQAERRANRWAKWKVAAEITGFVFAAWTFAVVACVLGARYGYVDTDAVIFAPFHWIFG